MERRRAEALVRNARQNNIKAILSVANKYFYGSNGFERDLEMSYVWYKRASALGNVRGVAFMGYMLATGVGVEKNEEEGISLLWTAVRKGSDWAAYMLGLAYLEGKCGLEVNRTEASYLLKKSLGGQCTCRHMSNQCIEDALLRLREISLPIKSAIDKPVLPNADKSTPPIRKPSLRMPRKNRRASSWV